MNLKISTLALLVLPLTLNSMSFGMKSELDRLRQGGTITAEEFAKITSKKPNAPLIAKRLSPSDLEKLKNSNSSVAKEIRKEIPDTSNTIKETKDDNKELDRLRQSTITEQEFVNFLRQNQSKNPDAVPLAKHLSPKDLEKLKNSNSPFAKAAIK